MWTYSAYPTSKAGELHVASATSSLVLTQRQGLDSPFSEHSLDIPQALFGVLFAVGSGQMRQCLMPFLPSPFFPCPVEGGGPQLLPASYPHPKLTLPKTLD